jgi:hypothetical protein
MGTTTFSGPVKAGSVREGASANVGFVVMAQTAGWTQSTTAVSTGMIIPANSQITGITLTINTAPDAGNLTLGTSITATEIISAAAVGTATDVVLDIMVDGTKATGGGAILGDIGTSDVTLYVDCSAGSAGRGELTVEYIQNINNS